MKWFAGILIVLATGCTTAPSSTDVVAWQSALRESDEAILSKTSETLDTVKDNTSALKAIQESLVNIETLVTPKDPPPAESIDTEPAETPEPETKTQKIDSKQQESTPAVSVQTETIVTPPRQWYLVSEPWCSNCPQAKKVFKAKGWPDKNIISIKECERRFGFRPPHVPFEFGDPNTSQSVTIQRVQSSAASGCNCSSACTCGCQSGGVCTCGQVRSPAQSYIQPTQRLPVVNTQWGRIDLQTYNRPGCNCPMCQGIRSLQAQYQTMSLPAPVPPAQEPTPQGTLAQMVELLQLSESDVLADFGCGDGRILIAATERYGCRGIGIEIDPVKANAARQAVYDAGLEARIEIITGDVLDFEPSRHGVTAATAYLYPELLTKLAAAGKFAGLRAVASPYHEIPGLKMRKVGDVYVAAEG